MNHQKDHSEPTWIHSHFSCVSLHLQLWWHLYRQNGPKTFTEYIPKWLGKSVPQNTMTNYADRDPGSSVAKHSITTEHTIDLISCFKPLLHNTDRKILAFSEAMLIRLLDPVSVHKSCKHRLCVCHGDEVNCLLY